MTENEEDEAKQLLRDIIYITRLIDYQSDFNLSGVIEGYKFTISINIEAKEELNNV